jgi:ribosomal-protein-alanine N-acetyltransferase
MIASQSLATFPTYSCDALPVLSGQLVKLRELEMRDAPSLFAMINDPEVSRFISRPPMTLEAFERFIAWTREERRSGRYMCFGIVPHGMDTAVGLIHIRRLDPGFGTFEWGFALGSPFWGTGVFTESAELLIDFAFDAVGVNRLEARVALPNRRANAALRKVGAVQEAILRKSFLCQGEHIDQALWSILHSDRQERKLESRRKSYVH